MTSERSATLAFGMLPAGAVSAEAGGACVRVLVECGCVRARVGVEWWWVGVMGWLRSAEKWMGAVASARAVRRRKSGEEIDISGLRY